MHRLGDWAQQVLQHGAAALVDFYGDLHACAGWQLLSGGTATDAQLVEGMKFFAERMKMLVEPTGALSFAAARHAGLPIAGKRVGVIVSGGNVDLQRFAELVKN